MTQKCKEIKVYFGSFKDLFKVQIIPSQTIESDGEPVKRVLASDHNLKTIGVTKDEIKVKVEFTSPLDVSPFDKIYIEMNFREFDEGFDPNYNITRQCVRQAIPGPAIESVQAVGSSATVATTTTAAVSGIWQTLMSGCLAQLWGMINGM